MMSMNKFFLWGYIIRWWKSSRETRWKQLFKLVKINFTLFNVHLINQSLMHCKVTGNHLIFDRVVVWSSCYHRLQVCLDLLSLLTVFLRCNDLHIECPDLVNFWGLPIQGLAWWRHYSTILFISPTFILPKQRVMVDYCLEQLNFSQVKSSPLFESSISSVYGIFCQWNCFCLPSFRNVY